MASSVRQPRFRWMTLRFTVPFVCSCIAVASLYLAQSIASAFAADATAPETTIDSGPSSPTRASTLTFAFSSSETGSSFECSLDGAASIPCSSPTTLGPLADGAHSFAVKATGPFENGYISPTLTDSHQGYATDGTYHYLFGTNSISKDDATWSLVVENTDANSGLASTHLGDGDYYNGYLYVPSELFGGCKSGDVNSSQSIFVFDASDLSRVGVHDISAQNEISSVAVAPDIGANGTIFASDYCDPSYIYEYDLSSFKSLGDIHLSHGIYAAQGIAYRNGRLYVASDNQGGNLYAVDPLSGATAVVYTSDNVGVANWEGIDYSQDTLRWTLDYSDGTEQVQYLSAGATDGSPAVRSFAVDTIAPQTTINSGLSGPTDDSTPSFAFSSNET
ncbi:MAG: hypothetical protein ABSC51_09840, partial [Gaiellaceae bacterium]